jgi:hypothetical protein
VRIKGRQGIDVAQAQIMCMCEERTTIPFQQKKRSMDAQFEESNVCFFRKNKRTPGERIFLWKTLIRNAATLEHQELAQTSKQPIRAHSFAHACTII